MSDFKAKMYQIQFRMGLRSKGRGREGEWKGGNGKGSGGDKTPPLPSIHISGYAPDLGCLSPISDQTKNLKANSRVQMLRIS